MSSTSIRTITVVSNTPGLANVVIDGLRIEYIDATSPWQVYAASRTSDYVILLCDLGGVLRQCLYRLLPLKNTSKLICVDTVMSVPEGFRQKLKVRFRSLLFRKVHLFFEYFKDWQGYKNYHRMPLEKFRYVPFKVNRYEHVLAKLEKKEVSDKGYIFCGGNTRRDFDSLLEVARRTGYPFVIVTMDNKSIGEHGSYLDEESIPANVNVVRHDGSDSFLDYIADAKLAALPIKKKNVSASGIGVYLACMALGKCVVISSGPSVNGILQDEQQALIVPPEDIDALQAAVVKAYENDELREKVSVQGQNYALSLGGEAKLYENIIRKLLAEEAS